MVINVVDEEVVVEVEGDKMVAEDVEEVQLIILKCKHKTNLTDRYYQIDEWQTLSFDEQQQVRALRNERDKKCGLSSVVTFTSPPPQTYPPNTAATVATDLTGPSHGTGISAVMSQRTSTTNSNTFNPSSNRSL
jgi:hypothetical protein